MTGASGAPYAVRLLGVLLAAGRDIELVISPSAAQVLRDELGVTIDTERFDVAVMMPLIDRSFQAGPGKRSSIPLAPGRIHYRHHMDWHAGIASGTFLTD